MKGPESLQSQSFKGLSITYPLQTTNNKGDHCTTLFPFNNSEPIFTMSHITAMAAAIRKQLGEEAFNRLLGLDNPKGTKGVIQGNEPPLRKAELYVELMVDTEKTPCIGGEAAYNNVSIPGYPNSLSFGCGSEDLEYITSFIGLANISPQADADVSELLINPKFLEKLCKFVHSPPNLSKKKIQTKAGPRQVGEVFAHVMGKGPFKLLKNMCWRNPQRSTFIAALLKTRKCEGLLERLVEMALRTDAFMEVWCVLLEALTCYCSHLPSLIRCFYMKLSHGS